MARQRSSRSTHPGERRRRGERPGSLLSAGEQLEATFEAMTDAVLVFDAHGRIQRANRAAHDLLGLTPEILAQGLEELGSLVHPRDEYGQSLPREQWPSERVLRGEVLTGTQAVDVLVSIPDGRELHLSISGAPVQARGRRTSAAILVLRDVTERRRLERRTREALGALLTMAEAMVEAPRGPDSDTPPRAVIHRLGVLTCEVLGCRSVGIISAREDGRLHPLDCVGLPPAQVEQWRERVAHWPRQTEVFRGVTARLRSGELVLFDTTLPEYRSMANPFGIERYLLAPMLVGTTLVGLLSLNYGPALRAEAPGDAALIQAISRLAALVIERERLQQEREEARSHALALEEANRRMDTFLGIAGHEMRTPLTSITGNIELAQRQLARIRAQAPGAASDTTRDLAAMDRFLNRTHGSLRRLDRLVRDVLDVARIQADHLRFRLAPADLDAVVRDVVDEHREMAAPRTIDLQDAGVRSIPVLADADRIAQVVANYLSNALKYSPPDRPVTVGIEVDGAEARVWVRDEGPGVPRAEQEHIWDRFYRVAETSPEHGSSIGLGLGLHISRSIIEQHRGRVGIESDVDAGALFWFTLPLAPAAATT